MSQNFIQSSIALSKSADTLLADYNFDDFITLSKDLFGEYQELKSLEVLVDKLIELN